MKYRGIPDGPVSTGRHEGAQSPEAVTASRFLSPARASEDVSLVTSGGERDSRERDQGNKAVVDRQSASSSPKQALRGGIVERSCVTSASTVARSDVAADKNAAPAVIAEPAPGADEVIVIDDSDDEVELVATGRSRFDELFPPSVPAARRNIPPSAVPRSSVPRSVSVGDHEPIAADASNASELSLRVVAMDSRRQHIDSEVQSQRQDGRRHISSGEQSNDGEGRVEATLDHAAIEVSRIPGGNLCRGSQNSTSLSPDASGRNSTGIPPQKEQPVTGEGSRPVVRLGVWDTHKHVSSEPESQELVPATDPRRPCRNGLNLISIDPQQAAGQQGALPQLGDDRAPADEGPRVSAERSVLRKVSLKRGTKNGPVPVVRLNQKKPRGERVDVIGAKLAASRQSVTPMESDLVKEHPGKSALSQHGKPLACTGGPESNDSDAESSETLHHVQIRRFGKVQVLHPPSKEKKSPVRNIVGPNSTVCRSSPESRVASHYSGAVHPARDSRIHQGRACGSERPSHVLPSGMALVNATSKEPSQAVPSEMDFASNVFQRPSEALPSGKVFVNNTSKLPSHALPSGSVLASSTSQKPSQALPSGTVLVSKTWQTSRKALPSGTVFATSQKGRHALPSGNVFSGKTSGRASNALPSGRVVVSGAGKQPKEVVPTSQSKRRVVPILSTAAEIIGTSKSTSPAVFHRSASSELLLPLSSYFCSHCGKIGKSVYPRVCCSQRCSNAVEANLSAARTPGKEAALVNFAAFDWASLSHGHHRDYQRMLLGAIHRSRPFTFVGATSMYNLSPHAYSAYCEGKSGAEVCAVCGLGGTVASKLYNCSACILAFHHRCIAGFLPEGESVTDSRWTCPANRQGHLIYQTEGLSLTKVKDGDEDILEAKEKAGPGSISFAFNELTLDAKACNPYDFELHPDLRGVFYEEYGADWQICFDCEQIRVIAPGQWATCKPLRFRCAHAMWLPEDRRCCGSENEAEQALVEVIGRHRQYRSRRRSFLMSQFGEGPDRESFGWPPYDCNELVEGPGLLRKAPSFGPLHYSIGNMRGEHPLEASKTAGSANAGTSKLVAEPELPQAQPGTDIECEVEAAPPPLPAEAYEPWNVSAILKLYLVAISELRPSATDGEAENEERATRLYTLISRLGAQDRVMLAMFVALYNPREPAGSGPLKDAWLRHERRVRKCEVNLGSSWFKIRDPATAGPWKHDDVFASLEEKLCRYCGTLYGKPGLSDEDFDSLLARVAEPQSEGWQLAHYFDSVVGIPGLDEFLEVTFIKEAKKR